MFETDESVNQLFDYSMHLVDSLAKKHNVCYDFDIRNIQYLVFAGMVSYYGYENIKEICKAFSNQFIYNTRNYILENYEYVDCPSSTIGLFHQHLNIKRGVTGNYYNFDNEIFVFRNAYCNIIQLIDTVVHEYNHSLNSINKPIVNLTSDQYMRCGLRLISINRTGINYFNNMEECINTLQTAQIVKNIIYFNNFNIKDKSLRRILSGAKNQYYDFTLGDTNSDIVELVRLISPLYQNPNFKKAVEKARISGNINLLRDDFDKKTHDGAYYDLISSLDKFDLTYSFGKEVPKVKKLVNTYLNK